MSEAAVPVRINSLRAAKQHFGACCSCGDLEGAQAIFALGYAIHRKYVLGALKRACAGGHLAVAQWLAVYFDVSDKEARLEENYMFRRACGNGHTEVARWLAREFELTPAEVDRAAVWALWQARNMGATKATLELYEAEFGLRYVKDAASGKWVCAPAQEALPSEGSEGAA